MPMQYDSILLAEMTPDSSDFQKNGLVLASNVIPTDAGWREIKGRLALLTTPISATTCGYFSDPAGLIYIGSQKRLFVYNDSVVGITDVSNGGTDYPVCTAWRFVRYGPTVVAAANNASTPLQKRLTTGGTFTDLVTSADRPVPAHLAVCRSHLIGANILGGAGVYATAQPNQYAWCARSNASTWTPGTDRAGFALLVDDDGDSITAAIGFTDFALLFQGYGVTRLSYTGGDLVWQPDKIASGAFGLSNVAWAGSLVRAGRDVYYWSNAGPAVVTNAESAQLIGGARWRRFLMDSFQTYSADRLTQIVGSYDADMHQVIWTYKAIAVAAQVQAVYDISTDRLSVVAGEDALSGGNQVLGLAHSRSGVSSFPLDRLRNIEFDTPTGNLTISAYTNLARSLPATLTSNIWRPSSGKRAELHGVRIVWRCNLRGGTLPTLTLSIDYSDDPLMNTVTTINLPTSLADRDGFISSASFPLVAGNYRFSVKVPSMSLPSIAELTALEIAYQDGTSFF